MTDKLTLKQEKFCNEYTTNGGNASEAYRKAYDASGMKYQSINVNASKLLKNAKIALRIAQLQAPVAKKYNITREYITEELLGIIIESKPEDGFNQGGGPIVLRASDPDLRRKTIMDLAKVHGLIVDVIEDSRPRVIMPMIEINGAPYLLPIQLKELGHDIS